MIQISKLQQCLKGKKRSSRLTTLFDVIKVLESTDAHIHLTLNHKGILLQLLARVCFNQYELFSKIFTEYYDDLQGGILGTKNKTTVKKRRNAGQGGTTTVKRKKQNTQIARGGIDINQMLDKQLSTPHNTEPRSHNSLQQSKKRIQFQLGTVQKLEIAPIFREQFITPLKQANEEEQSNKLDQYRTLIDIPSKKKPRGRGKNQDGTIKTRKKPTQTQLLHQQINKDISLNLTSQISIRKQLEDIIQATKKKKIHQNENLIHHELFTEGTGKENFNFENKERIKLFYRQNLNKFGKGNLYNDNQFSQQSDRLSIYAFGKQDQYLSEQEYILEQKTLLASMRLDQELKKSKQIKFSVLTSSLNLKKQDKSALFYDLLCKTGQYKLSQGQTNKFGQITISLIKRSIF